jgi:hypothetical protein
MDRQWIVDGALIQEHSTHQYVAEGVLIQDTAIAFNVAWARNANAIITTGTVK